MEKLKVVVYAISKNESKFVSRWVNSMKEADEIIVLDTGSEDDTVAKLKELGVKVYEHVFYPWRFDTARNESLSYVPKDTDICVCTDLDEVFEPGWREILEREWVKENPTRARYNFNWKLDEENRPCVNFWINKIHNRSDYHSHHPVHEILKYEGVETFAVTDNIVLNHYPDRSKSRGSYLPLLEMSVKEDPNDDRNMHYLGREYMYYGKYNEAIDTLIRHLGLEKATWKDERCASMRFIGRCYKHLKRYDEAKLWLEKAIKEAPYLRDPYMEMALLYYELDDYDNTIHYVNLALNIKSHTKSYINETFSFGYTPYDLLSICYYNKGEIEASKVFLEKAIKIEPNDPRLNNNLKIINEKLKETTE